jgi:uncharacterized ion transporter superfamily protein YfcC
VAYDDWFRFAWPRLLLLLALAALALIVAVVSGLQ